VPDEHHQLESSILGEVDSGRDVSHFLTAQTPLTAAADPFLPAPGFNARTIGKSTSRVVRLRQLSPAFCNPGPEFGSVFSTFQ
jgi:hypothetical protein